MNIELLGGLAALITVFGGWYVTESIRRKNTADATDSIVNAAINLVTQKDKDLAAYRKEEVLLHLYIVYLVEGISLLSLQIKGRSKFRPKTLEQFRVQQGKTLE